MRRIFIGGGVNVARHLALFLQSLRNSKLTLLDVHFVNRFGLFSSLFVLEFPEIPNRDYTDKVKQLEGMLSKQSFASKVYELKQKYERNETLKVLVVDDEERVFDYIKESHQSIQWMDFLFTDGTNVEETINHLPGVDVILLDIHISGFSNSEFLKTDVSLSPSGGYANLRVIQDYQPNIPIFMISDKDWAPDEITRFWQEGAWQFFEKPDITDEENLVLVDTIQTLIDEDTEEIVVTISTDNVTERLFQVIDFFAENNILVDTIDFVKTQELQIKAQSFPKRIVVSGKSAKMPNVEELKKEFERACAEKHKKPLEEKEISFAHSNIFYEMHTV